MRQDFFPKFKCSYLRPKHWLTWVGVFICIITIMLPVKLKKHFLYKLGKRIGHLSVGARQRANVNLLYCMPELTTIQREKIIDDMFLTKLQSVSMIFDLALKGRVNVERRIVWHGKDIISRLYKENSNVIFLAPQGFSIDIPAILISSYGKNISIIIQKQYNPIVDYLLNRLRKKFKMKIHLKNHGIKPFIDSVSNGYWGYYHPEMDNSVCQNKLVDYFATYKATSPTAGMLMKICNAKIVPIFTVYNSEKQKLEVFLRPPMNDLQCGDSAFQARRINEEIEYLVKHYPEQYNWTLKPLKIRKSGEKEPYKRNDLFW